MTENEQRAAVVAEIRTWIGTPYHHMACVKGAGVDCAMILKAAFEGAGLVEPFTVPKYTHDWHFHQNREAYIGMITEYLTETTTGDLTLEERASDPEFKPLPGDIIMFKIGRTYSHGCMVTEWPFVVHATHGSNRVEEITALGTAMARRPSKVFTRWSSTVQKDAE